MNDTMRKMLFALTVFCLAYLILIPISFAVSTLMQFPSFKEVGHLQDGCYWTNAMVSFIECKGVWLNGFVKFFLNFWMTILYAAMFAINAIFGFSFSIGWLLSTLWILLVYSPFFYLIWYWKKGQYI